MPDSRIPDDKRTPREEFDEWYAQLTPDEQEIEDWARRERKRREDWVSGPTEAEKLLWIRRRRATRMIRAMRGGDLPPYDPGSGFPPPRMRSTATARRSSREAELAAKGFWYMMFNWPARAWEDMVRAGSAWEEDMYSARRPARIPYEYEYDDDLD